MSSVTYVHNEEFRDYAAKGAYPFTDNSAYTASDGRRLPRSAFLDLMLYPPDRVDGPVHVHGIRCRVSDSIEIGFTRGGEMWAYTVIPRDGEPSWGAVKTVAGLVCGTLVMSVEGLKYIGGLAEYSTLFFNPGALVVRPDRILPVVRPLPSLAVGGREVPISAGSLSAEFTSSRFTFAENEEGPPEYSFDTTLHTLSNKAVKTPFAGVVVGETEFVARNGSVTVMAPRWSNLQVVTQGESLMIHKRGDSGGVG